MNNKKNGIITLHKNVNYGANLQAFATCKFLNDNGIPTSVIDYLPKKQDKENHFWSLMALIIKNEPNKSIKRMIKLILSLFLIAPSKIRRLHKFNKFRKSNMHLTKYCKDSSDIVNQNFDTIICGSDQIWNADITQGIDPVYYGDIPGVNNRISYAASLGNYRFSKKNEAFVKKLITNLTSCSIREKDTQAYIKDVAGVNSQLVCDPVFLLDKSTYVELFRKRLIKHKYILVYSIISDDEMLGKASEYAKYNNLVLVEICASKNRKRKHIQLDSLGPEEFLNAFYYADAIFTNSFHGTAFSIIFEKNFYVFNNKYGGSRLVNLLKIAGLNEKLIDKETDINSLNQQTDYNSVRNNLKELINSSKIFLMESINNELNLVAGDSCVGCGACAEICPTKSIKLIKAKDGFENALIVKNTCIKCNLCKAVCPALRDLSDLTEFKSVYAYKSNDEVRIESTSGGAFTDVAEFILSKNGIVYGASLNETFSVEHINVSQKEELSHIRGVKYVQSDIGHTFDLISEDLKNGRYVLFTGTPCQVSAIKEYIKLKKIDKDKLFLVDIICHGVPSPLVFKNYIKWLERKFNANVKTYKFRDKNISWRGNSSSVEFVNGNLLKNDKYTNIFMNLYYSNFITRKSCYQCRYTSLKRISDLTISDYWGIENQAPEFEDSLGVSMILVNTPKGEKLISALNSSKMETTINGVKQPRLFHPTEKPDYREDFWLDFHTKGFDFMAKKYGGLRKNVINIVKSKIKSLLAK